MKISKEKRKSNLNKVSCSINFKIQSLKERGGEFEGAQDATLLLPIGQSLCNDALSSWSPNLLGIISFLASLILSSFNSCLRITVSYYVFWDNGEVSIVKFELLLSILLFKRLLLFEMDISLIQKCPYILSL